MSVFLDSITHPSEIKALLNYKFSSKSENKLSHQRALASDPRKKQCYYYLNMVTKKNTSLNVLV